MVWQTEIFHDFTAAEGMACAEPTKVSLRTTIRKRAYTACEGTSLLHMDVTVPRGVPCGCTHMTPALLSKE